MLLFQYLYSCLLWNSIFSSRYAAPAFSLWGVILNSCSIPAWWFHHDNLCEGLSGIERCTRMHQLSCRNLYFMRLFSSVSPICLRINGTTTNLICSAHTTLYPLKYSVQRKLGLYTKSFSSAGSKVLSSPTLAVPRYQIGSCDPAVRRNETLLQGRAMVPGKNNNGEHFLWHLKQKSIQMFYMHAVFIEWQKCNHSPNRSIYCLCHQEAARTLDGVPTVGVPCW